MTDASLTGAADNSRRSLIVGVLGRLSLQHVCFFVRLAFPPMTFVFIFSAGSLVSLSPIRELAFHRPLPSSPSPPTSAARPRYPLSSIRAFFLSLPLNLQPSSSSSSFPSPFFFQPSAPQPPTPPSAFLLPPVLLFLVFHPSPVVFFVCFSHEYLLPFFPCCCSSSHSWVPLHHSILLLFQSSSSSSSPASSRTTDHFTISIHSLSPSRGVSPLSRSFSAAAGSLFSTSFLFPFPTTQLYSTFQLTFDFRPPAATPPGGKPTLSPTIPRRFVLKQTRRDECDSFNSLPPK